MPSPTLSLALPLLYVFTTFINRPRPVHTTSNHGEDTFCYAFLLLIHARAELCVFRLQQSVNPTAFRRLLREIRQLQTEPPEGIRISTDDEDILDVTGIIQGPGTSSLVFASTCTIAALPPSLLPPPPPRVLVHVRFSLTNPFVSHPPPPFIELAGTPYEGGYFRVKFKFTEEFPAAPPKCGFNVFSFFKRPSFPKHAC